LGTFNSRNGLRPFPTFGSKLTNNLTPSSLKKTVFISLLDWGLGHATRLLPLIKYLEHKNYIIYIGASGRAREVLRQEVSNCIFLDFPRYPVRYSRSRFFVTRFMLTTFPAMLLTMYREKKRLRILHENYNFDLIISDNRFSARIVDIPSLLVSHQLRYKLPWPLKKMEWLPEYFNARLFNKFNHIIVPDIKGQNSYTGDLSHNMRYLDQKKLYYAGIISGLRDQKTSEMAIQLNDSENRRSLTEAQQRSNRLTELAVKQPVPQLEYLVIISGPEPQRTQFEKIIRDQIKELSGTAAIAMGLPEKNYKISIGNKIFYTYLSRSEMSKFMAAAEFIIGRPGYTSVMEMIELGKRGLFIPTPGQVEQEYLARYYQSRNWCHFIAQHKLNLTKDIAIAKEYPGFPRSEKNVNQNIEKIYNDLLIGKKSS
jgi:hypothetical protein